MATSDEGKLEIRRYRTADYGRRITELRTSNTGKLVSPYVQKRQSSRYEGIGLRTTDNGATDFHNTGKILGPYDHYRENGGTRVSVYGQRITELRTSKTGEIVSPYVQTRESWRYEVIGLRTTVYGQLITEVRTSNTGKILSPYVQNREVGGTSVSVYGQRTTDYGSRSYGLPTQGKF